MVRGGLQSLNINPRLSINLERGWSLNRVTGTNGIATWSDLSTTYVTRGTSNQCPTKSQIENAVKSGYKVSIPSSYASNQLVKYTDCSFSANMYSCTIKITTYNSNAYLYISRTAGGTDGGLACGNSGTYTWYWAANIGSPVNWYLRAINRSNNNNLYCSPSQATMSNGGSINVTIS